jgi:hypothetical protein
LLTIDRNQDDSLSILKYQNLSLSQTATFVADHLEQNCIANKRAVRTSFDRLKENAKEPDLVIQAFKNP